MLRNTMLFITNSLISILVIIVVQFLRDYLGNSVYGKPFSLSLFLYHLKELLVLAVLAVGICNTIFYLTKHARFMKAKSLNVSALSTAS